MGDSIDGGSGIFMPNPIPRQNFERWFAWYPVRCQTNRWHWLCWMYRDIWRYDTGASVVVVHLTPKQLMYYRLKHG